MSCCIRLFSFTLQSGTRTVIWCRHMYLESKLPQLQPQGAMAGGPHPALGGALRAANPYGRLALPPCLSDRAKEVRINWMNSEIAVDYGSA
jgi:hypothetical protein